MQGAPSFTFPDKPLSNLSPVITTNIDISACGLGTDVLKTEKEM